MFSYRTILKQSLAIAWKHKYLWFFGLFASLAIASGSLEYRFISESLSQGVIAGSYQSLNSLLAFSFLSQEVWAGIIGLFSENILVILNTLTVLILFFLVVAVFIWLAISSQAALVYNIKKIAMPGKKKADTATIREGLTVGNRHFWSVLGLNILISVLIFFALFIISLPLLFLVISNSGSFVAAYTILFVIFVPVSVSLSLIIKYAIAGCVLENKRMMSSLKDGWRLFRKNWLISLEMAVILFIISFLASFLILLAVSILFLPLLWLGIIFSVNWLVYLMLLLCLVAAAVFGAFFTSFQVSTWTNLYLHLKNNKGQAKLERIFKKK